MEKDGRFRLRSAYNLVAGDEDDEPGSRWKDLWQWKGPNRIKHFLWLVMHGRLLTNKERTRRKISTNSQCNFCKDQDETIEHILRSCSRAKSIWDKFNDKCVANSMNLPLHDWLMDNIRQQGTGTDFGIIIWHLWKQRNEEVMEGRIFSRDSLIARIQAWFCIVEQAKRHAQKTTCSNSATVQSRLVCWEPPREDWIQIQSDGSVITQTGKAAAGGLFRDYLGRCKGAYVCNLGSCSITAAELKGALEGLKIAWKEGYRKIELKLDSTTAVDIIKQCDRDDHRHGSIAKQFDLFFNLDWEVCVSHVFREANFAADYLASKAHDFDFGTHRFNVCDRDLVQWLSHDVLGTSHDRNFNVN
ncbi:unnamed protein product [Linum tenue]|uniref:RNase H type-1 domain-containing protein n=1 Tax=Linum tenue TaxID=586396 RepID=A0AAV0JK22_9ROSI|nr:unnamed protein product [Linum tenue]